MSDTLIVQSSTANLRATASTAQAPLAPLPAGHPVQATGPQAGTWQPVRTMVRGETLRGFVSAALLRAPISPEVDRLVRLAGQEYEEFAFGRRHETHPDSRRRIAMYWAPLGESHDAQAVPWSAAFISFVVREAALARSFKFSGRHTTYLSDSKRARLAQDDSRAWWTQRLEEAPLRVGDMVAGYRTGGDCGQAVRTYDSLPGDFCAHCDIVVGVGPGRALAIGGNVGNTVKVTEIALDEAGCVQPLAKRFAILSRRF